MTDFLDNHAVPPRLRPAELLRACATRQELGYTVAEAVADLYGPSHPGALAAATDAPLLSIIEKTTASTLPDGHVSWLTWHQTHLPLTPSSLRAAADLLDTLDFHRRAVAHQELFSAPHWGLLAIASGVLGVTLAGPLGLLALLCLLPLWAGRAAHRSKHPVGLPHEQLTSRFITQAHLLGLETRDIETALATRPTQAHTPEAKTHTQHTRSSTAAEATHWFPISATAALAVFAVAIAVARVLDTYILHG